MFVNSIQLSTAIYVLKKAGENSKQLQNNMVQKSKIHKYKDDGFMFLSLYHQWYGIFQIP